MPCTDCNCQLTQEQSKSLSKSNSLLDDCPNHTCKHIVANHSSASVPGDESKIISSLASIEKQLAQINVSPSTGGVKTHVHFRSFDLCCEPIILGTLDEMMEEMGADSCTVISIIIMKSPARVRRRIWRYLQEFSSLTGVRLSGFIRRFSINQVDLTIVTKTMNDEEFLIFGGLWKHLSKLWDVKKKDIEIDRKNFTMSKLLCHQFQLVKDGVGEYGYTEDFDEEFNTDACSVVSSVKF